MTFAAALATGVGVGVAEAAAGAAAVAAETAATTAIGEGAALAVAAAAESAFSLGAILNTASLAWTIGSTISSFFQGNQGVTGPRLKDVHVQSATFGTPMKRFWGVDRMAGVLVWIGSDGQGGRGIREHKHELSAGKGKGGPASAFYTYDADFAVSVNASSRCKGVIRIWAGPKLIYDVSADASMQSLIGTGVNLMGDKGTVTFYDGAEDQKPPAIIEALEGVGNTTAYRNQFLAVFTNFDVSEYHSIPQLSFECYTDGEQEYELKYIYDTQSLANHDPGAGISWSYVDQNGEIVVLVGNQLSSWNNVQPPGDRDPGQPIYRMFRLLADGSIIPEEKPVAPDRFDDEPYFGGNFRVGHSDEPLMILYNTGFIWLIRPGMAIVHITAAPPPSGFMPNNLFAKSGDDIWMANDGTFTIGFARFNVNTGGLISYIPEADLPAFYASAGNGLALAKGDDFLWWLSWFGKPTAGRQQLVKIDPDRLEIVGTVDITVAGLSFIAFDVHSDNEIYLLGASVPGTYRFFQYDGENLIDLGAGPPTDLTNFDSSTLIVRNGLWYFGSLGAWGFHLLDIRVFAPAAQARCCPLWKIVRDICIACGLGEEDIDVSELTDCVEGYTLDQQMSGRDAITPLQRYAFFDGRESDLKLDFIRRGHNAVATIPEDDLAARPSLDTRLPDAQTITRGQETELPSFVSVRFKDQDASYQTGEAHSARLTTESKNLVTVDVPVVMTATKAKRIAYVLMANNWLERSPREVQISRRYLPLDAADPVDIEVAA